MAFLSKISLDWPLTFITQPSTSKLSDNPEPALYVRTFCFSVNNPEYHCTGSIKLLCIVDRQALLQCRCSMSTHVLGILMDQQYGIYVFGLDVISWEKTCCCVAREIWAVFSGHSTSI